MYFVLSSIIKVDLRGLRLHMNGGQYQLLKCDSSQMKDNIKMKRWHTYCLGHCTSHEDNRRCSVMLLWLYTNETSGHCWCSDWISAISSCSLHLYDCAFFVVQSTTEIRFKCLFTKRAKFVIAINGFYWGVHIPAMIHVIVKGLARLLIIRVKVDGSTSLILYRKLINYSYYSTPTDLLF